MKVTGNRENEDREREEYDVMKLKQEWKERKGRERRKIMKENCRWRVS